MPSIEAVTTAVLSATLDLAARQQALLAANVANANAPDYVSMRVSFDASLEQARAALGDQGWLDAATVRGIDAQIEPLAVETGIAAGVRVDQEMVALASNAVQFQALAQGLSRHLGLLALAAGDGRK